MTEKIFGGFEAPEGFIQVIEAHEPNGGRLKVPVRHVDEKIGAAARRLEVKGSALKADFATDRAIRFQWAIRYFLCEFESGRPEVGVALRNRSSVWLGLG